MRVSPEHRRVVLGIALASTLIATAVLSDGDDPREVVQPVIKPISASAAERTRAAAPDVLARLDPGRLDRRAGGAGDGNPFAARSWHNPSPLLAPTVAPPKPAAPAPPPLPFTFLGRMTDTEGKTVVFLYRKDRVYAVSAGERLDEDYLLDSISDSELSFTFLPLKMRQALTLQAR